MLTGKQLTEKQVEVFTRLKHDPALAEFKAWVADELAGFKELLVFQSAADAVKVIQGRAQVMTRILELIESGGRQAE